MEDKPLVSIIMPCYNGHDYLRRALDSVLEQTYPRVELVFVDDGSTDDTVEIAKSYSDRFSQKNYILKLYEQTNQGPGYAAINGLEKAMGDFLSYLDSDDMLLPSSVEIRAEALMGNPKANVSRTNGYVVPENNVREDKNLLVTSDDEKKAENLFAALIEGRVNNFSGTFMVRASAVKDYYQGHPIPRSDFGQNLQLLLPGAWNSSDIYIDEPLMRYVVRGGSHSHPKNLAEKIRLINGYYEIRKEILSVRQEDSESLLRSARTTAVRMVLDAILACQDGEGLNKKQLFDQYYVELQHLNGLTLEYKMHHAILHKSPKRFLYRGLYYIERRLQRKNIS